MRADKRFGDCLTPIISCSVVDISPIRKRLCKHVVCSGAGASGAGGDGVITTYLMLTDGHHNPQKLSVHHCDPAQSPQLSSSLRSLIINWSSLIN